MKKELTPFLSSIQETHRVHVDWPANFQGKLAVSGPPWAVRHAAKEVEDFICALREKREHARTFAKEDKEGQLLVEEKFHGAIIGKNGEVRSKLQADSGCKISVPKKGTRSTKIRIEGTSKAQIDACKESMARIVSERKLSEERFKAREAARERKKRLIVRSLDVPSAMQRFVVGKDGETVIALRKQFECDVSIPAKGSDSPTVSVSGLDEARVVQCVSAIQAIVERNTTEAIDVPKYLHSVIIGRNGETVRGLSTRYNGSIQVPARGSPSSVIQVRAETHDMRQSLISDITTMVDDHRREEICIPQQYHRFIVGPRGDTIRRLMRVYSGKITVPDREIESDVVGIQCDSAARRKDLAEALMAIARAA